MIGDGEVRLRAISPGDIGLLRTWQSDPAIMTGWAMPQPLLASSAFETDVAGRFQRFDASGHFIIEAPVGPVGRIDYEHLDPRHRSVELMLYIGELAAQGKGYAGAAIRALVRYLIHQRAVHRVELTTLAWNERARNLYLRLGFRIEGELRDFIFLNGRWHSETQMALLATDDIPWLSLPPGFPARD